MNCATFDFNVAAENVFELLVWSDKVKVGATKVVMSII